MGSACAFLYRIHIYHKIFTAYEHHLYLYTQFPDVAQRFANKELAYGTNMIKSDFATNWATSLSGQGKFRVFKFVPYAGDTYEYVSQCSNRGICNNEDGLCDCYKGYTGQHCEEQSTVAL